ncbi:MAG: hypothetical protein AUK44_04405 [Porphyromonadaceae bacterium CG2_30_38_12]|nr:MAG: hypothetical protein AUK44_04405 [Porphyromonadaceae bacterium CG2_30_38_12]
MSQKIEHNGIITHIDGKAMQVSIVQVSACSSCHAKGACSSSDMDEKVILVENNDQSLQIGDAVILTGESSMGLFAVLIAFVIPFLLILFILLILPAYTTNEALAGTLALGTLIPYYLLLSLFKSKLKNKLKFTATKV